MNRPDVVPFDTDDVFWADWWRNWYRYGTVYATNNPVPRIVAAETLTIHEGPCPADAPVPEPLDRPCPTSYHIRAKVPWADLHCLTAGMVIRTLKWTSGKKGNWIAEMEVSLPAPRGQHETFTEYATRRLGESE